MAYPYIPPVSNKFITVQIEDISTAGQKYVVPGFRGKIRKIHAVINGALTDADADLSAKIDGTAVTGSLITVAFDGSAAGDSFSSIPTGANFFTESSVIEVETDGASTGTVEVVITLELEVA
jgi:hypothetical protein